MPWKTWFNNQRSYFEVRNPMFRSGTGVLYNGFDWLSSTFRKDFDFWGEEFRFVARML
jgi:hypothetical protein